MKRSACAAVAIVLLATLPACSIIKAQPVQTTTTGTLQGVVTGPNGPVLNAAVTVTAADATQHAGLTDSAGFYSIAQIPAGPATLSVRAAGFSAIDVSVVIAPDPNPNRQDISLNPQ